MSIRGERTRVIPTNPWKRGRQLATGNAHARGGMQARSLCMGNLRCLRHGGGTDMVAATPLSGTPPAHYGRLGSAGRRIHTARAVEEIPAEGRGRGLRWTQEGRHGLWRLGRTLLRTRCSRQRGLRRSRESLSTAPFQHSSPCGKVRMLGSLSVARNLGQGEDWGIGALAHGVSELPLTFLDRCPSHRLQLGDQ